MSLGHISKSQHLHANYLQFDMVEFLDQPLNYKYE